MAETQTQMLTAAAVANLFGLTASRIAQLSSDGVLQPQKVKGSRGRLYPLEDTVRRYIAHLRDQAASKGDAKERLIEANLYKTELQGRKLETEIALREGRVHSAEDVERVWNDIMNAFRMKLLSAPQVLTAQLVEIVGKERRQEIDNLLHNEIRAIMGLLTEYSAEEFYSRNRDYLEVEMNNEAGEEDEEAGV